MGTTGGAGGAAVQISARGAHTEAHPNIRSWGWLQRGTTLQHPRISSGRKYIMNQATEPAASSGGGGGGGGARSNFGG